MAEEHRKYADFEELVFEHRNKAYGAYELRRTYKGDLTKAFFIGVAIFLAVIVLPLMYINIKDANKPADDSGVIIDMTPDLPEIKEEQKEEKKEEIIEEVEKDVQSLKDLAPPPDTPPAATIQNVEVVPTQTPKIETPPPTIDEMKGKAIGTTTNDGVATSNNAPAQPKGVPGGQGQDELRPGATVVPDPVDKNVIHTAADKEPNFTNGGIEGLRKMVQSNFDTEAVEGEGILNTEVVFVVEPNGTISQVKASGKNSDFNREAERVIRSIRTKWEPAEKGGQKVRYRYRFPLKMRFE